MTRNRRHRLLVLPLPTVGPQQETRRFTPRRSAVFAGILLIVAALLFVILPPAWRSRSRGTGDATVQALAVLPFLNLSGDPGQDYFADGMTEALIVELSTLGGVRVISRTSSMQYKSVDKSVADIADELGVDAVVEGSVLRDGNRMRVTVQLVGARSDTNLWTQSFEREVGTILVFQRDVARTIAEAIDVTVGGPRPVVGRVDPEVYELYLRGRHLLNRRTEADLQKALEYFELVIRRDPANARAHAAVAAVWQAMSDWNNFVAPKDGLPKAKVAALRALELDSSLAEAHVRLAFVSEAYEWRLPEAEAGYKRALELDPNLAEAYQHYSLFLSRLGRGEESVEMGRRAHQLDPLSMARQRRIRHTVTGHWQTRRSLDASATHRRARPELLRHLRALVTRFRGARSARRSGRRSAARSGGVRPRRPRAAGARARVRGHR